MMSFLSNNLDKEFEIIGEGVQIIVLQYYKVFSINKESDIFFTWYIFTTPSQNTMVLATILKAAHINYEYELFIAWLLFIWKL